MEVLIVSAILAFVCFMLGFIIGDSSTEDRSKVQPTKEVSYKSELLSADINKKYNIEVDVSNPKSYDVDLDQRMPIVIYNQKCQIRKIK